MVFTLKKVIDELKYDAVLEGLNTNVMWRRLERNLKDAKVFAVRIF